MIPIPQYPLYSGSIDLLGGSQVGYYLEEEKGWGLSAAELQRSYHEAKTSGLNVRALVVINPGNPTGQILTVENMKEVIEFCHEYGLVLLADEVYQENNYIKEQRQWHSFKKVLRSMGSKYDHFEMFSFHSVSKGFTGECGHRGGYFECVGIDEEVKAQFYKLSSLQLCPNTVGQIMVSLMVNPPKPGDPSYALFHEESHGILESLKRRANKLTKFLDSLTNVSCNPAEGAMYAFPQVKLPSKAVEAARAGGKQPDVFYCIALLDATGVCVVPGSGFRQKDGTWHFRTTFLPPEEQIDGVLSSVAKFNNDFMHKYA